MPELPGLSNVRRVVASAGNAYAVHLHVIPICFAVLARFVGGVVYIQL